MGPRPKLNFFRIWSCCISNYQMTMLAANNLPTDTPSTQGGGGGGGGDQKVKLYLFLKVVMLHIKLKLTTLAATW